MANELERVRDRDRVVIVDVNISVDVEVLKKRGVELLGFEARECKTRKELVCKL